MENKSYSIFRGGRFAIIGHDDLEEEGYIEHAFQIGETDALELSAFLSEFF